MGYTVSIQRNETGEVREVHFDFEWKRCWWETGNSECDCNRALYFERDKGGEDPDIECSSHLYSVIKVIDDNGQGIDYREEPGAERLFG